MILWKWPPAAALAALTLVAGCTPALDWREVRFDSPGGRLVALFPCRPEVRTRALALAGQPATMHMSSCAAAERTYAVAFVDVVDPAAVTATLQVLRDSTVGNVAGRASAVPGVSLAGTTTNSQSGRIAVEGRLPGGTPVRVDAAFFVTGLRAYQVSVIGAPAPAPSVQSFFDALRLTT